MKPKTHEPSTDANGEGCRRREITPYFSDSKRAGVVMA